MADGLRSKTGQESTKDDEKFESLQLALSSTLTATLAEQRTFIEMQFAKFEDRLDSIKTEVTKNSNNIKKLKVDHKELSTHFTKTEETFQNTCSKLEASIAELEDRSRIPFFDQKNLVLVLVLVLSWFSARTSLLFHWQGAKLELRHYVTA